MDASVVQPQTVALRPPGVRPPACFGSPHYPELQRLTRMIPLSRIAVAIIQCRAVDHEKSRGVLNGVQPRLESFQIE
jgi:hypothetical protein